jgi:ubiquinone/menaquinone biosynthesis C-methylase UbiE
MKWIYRHPALYDIVDTCCSLSFSDRVRRSILGRADRDSLLEIGAGSGKSLALVASVLKIGLDRSSTMLRYGRHRCREMIPVMGDAHNLPFRDACVDLCVFSYCLRGLSRPMDAVKEAMRVSSEVIIIDYNRPRRMPRVIWDKVVNRFGRGVFGSRDIDYDSLERLSVSSRARDLYGGLYKVIVLKGAKNGQG